MPRLVWQRSTRRPDREFHAINCIAHYGVTVGKGDGTHAPGENVSAFHMRLFVQRAADLMGADGEAVLSSVMLSDTVTRIEMAQLMFGLVNDIDDDVRISPAGGQIEFYGDDASAWVVVDDFFADAKAQVPIADSQLIGATYEMGITRGTRGDGTLGRLFDRLSSHPPVGPVLGDLGHHPGLEPPARRVSSRPAGCFCEAHPLKQSEVLAAGKYPRSQLLQQPALN